MIRNPPHSRVIVALYLAAVIDSDSDLSQEFSEVFYSTLASAGIYVDDEEDKGCILLFSSFKNTLIDEILANCDVECGSLEGGIAQLVHKLLKKPMEAEDLMDLLPATAEKFLVKLKKIPDAELYSGLPSNSLN